MNPRGLAPGGNVGGMRQ